MAIFKHDRLHTLLGKNTRRPIDSYHNN